MKEKIIDELNKLRYLYGNKIILVDRKNNCDYEIGDVHFEECNEKYDGKNVYRIIYKDKKVYSIGADDIIRGNFEEKIVLDSEEFGKSKHFNVIGKDEVIYYYFDLYTLYEVGLDTEKIMDLFNNEKIYFILTEKGGNNFFGGSRYLYRKNPGVDPGPYRGTFYITINRGYTGPCGGGYDMTVSDPALVCKYSNDGIYKDIYGNGTAYTTEELYNKNKKTI